MIIIRKITMKFRLTAIYLTLLLLNLIEAKHKSYGGKLARVGQFPFVGVLSYDYSKACGASIIHERWALTAAHCLTVPRSKPLLTVGTLGDLESGATYEIEKFHVHPNYTLIPEEENNGLEYVSNDIGLIRLASNIAFNDDIQPITLETDEDNSYKNSMATLPGWGSAWYDEPMYHHLRYIKIRVLGLEECRQQWTYADKHICTSNKERQGSCNGDSGSPLVIDGKQIGIVSTGDTYCRSIKPDLYTKVASFVPWIRSILSLYGDLLPDSETH